MIPSLLQIPSAVSDSKLHSVLPNNGKGDFQFERSTGATRVNKDGLIEEVGYFSSELVQNGNFSELGSELVVNGSFESNSDWSNFSTPTTSEQSTDRAYIGNYSWYIIGTAFRQGIFSPNNFSLVNGKTYKASLWIYAVDGAEILSGVTNSDASVFTSRAVTQGEWTNVVYYFTANASSASYISILTSSSTLEFYVDNVSVKQVDPNDRWTLGTGWSYGDGVVSLNAPTGNFDQSLTATSGTKYKVTFTISNYVSGDIRWRFTGTSNENGTLRSANGTYVEEITLTNDQSIFRFPATGGVMDIDNVSVVEVQGDRPRLSYDITNGVVESQPHLLLEPSATNLIINSSSYSSWNKDSSVSITSSNNTSPTNESNASKITVTDSGRLYHDPTISTTADRVASIFIKAGTFVNFKFTCIASSQIDLNAETASNGFGIQKLPNGWYRISTTAQSVTSTSRRIQIQAYPDNTYTNGHGETGTYFVFGTQMEDSQLTSYIPTAGTTITRAAETCDNAKPSINNTEGVIYAEIAALVATAPTSQYISISDGTYNNRASILFSSGATNRIRCFLRVGGASQVDVTDNVTDVTDYNKVAFSYKANDFKVYINGTLVSSDTSGSVWSAGTVDTLSFSEINTTTGRFNGRVKGLALYGEALTDAQLIELTS